MRDCREGEQSNHKDAKWGRHQKLRPAVIGSIPALDQAHHLSMETMHLAI